jgi:hypothetical protein
MPQDGTVINENLLRVLREWQRECEQSPRGLSHPVLREQYDLATKFKRIADALEVGGTASIVR